MSHVNVCALLALAIIAVLMASGRTDDIDVNLGTKSGNKICLGKICNDASIFHYYVCCGQLVNDCCFRLQTWVIIVLVVLGVSILASIVCGMVKFICCCER